MASHDHKALFSPPPQPPPRDSSCPPTISYYTCYYNQSQEFQMADILPQPQIPPIPQIPKTKPRPTSRLLAQLQDYNMVSKTRSQSVPTKLRLRVRAKQEKDLTTNFPLLVKLKWELIPVLGDGNCLFRALSDQIFGHVDQYANIRAAVIQHFRQQQDSYIPFMAEDLRRSSRRRTKAVQNTDYLNPSAFSQRELFERRLAEMAKDNTWGDHLEIQAFCDVYNCNVIIFTEGLYEHIHTHPRGAGEYNELPTYYLAYHKHEHYSSVKDGLGPLPSTMQAFDIARGVSRQPTPALTSDSGQSQNSTTTSYQSDSERAKFLKRKRGRPALTKGAEIIDLTAEECKIKRIKLTMKSSESPQSSQA